MSQISTASFIVIKSVSLFKNNATIKFTPLKPLSSQLTTYGQLDAILEKLSAK